MTRRVENYRRSTERLNRIEQETIAHGYPSFRVALKIFSFRTTSKRVSLNYGHDDDDNDDDYH